MKTGLITTTVLTLSLCFCTAVSAEGSGSRRIADIDPVEIGKAAIGTKGLFSSTVQQDEAQILFAPRTNSVLLDCKIDNLKISLQLTEASRAAFIAAVREYSKEFDARTLNVRAKKTSDVYGRSNATLQWGAFTLNGKAEPKIRFGYTFIERKKPYFTLTMPEATNTGEQNDNVSVDDTSPLLILYFTKSQALALGEMLLQDNLIGKLKERGVFERAADDESYFPKSE